MKNYLLSGTVIGAIIASVGPSYSQATPTNLNVTVPPTGTPFKYNCVGGASPCWPLMSIYDGTTQATVNAGNNGLNTNVVGGSLTNITGSIPLPAGAATSALQSAVQSAAGTPDSTAITVQGNASGVPIPVTGSFSTSISGFQPTPAYAQLSASTGGSNRVSLPTGTSVIVYNTGSNPAFVTLGNGSITASAINDMIPANSAQAFTVGSNTFIAALSTGGSTILNISGGSGLPTGWGGGGGGGGSGGSNASVGLTGTGTPTSATYMGMVVAGNLTGVPGTSNGLKVDGSGVTQPVVVGSLPLPTGAATAANQEVTAAGSSAGSAQAVQGVTNGVPMPVSGTFWQTTQPVSASSLPLPAGAATAANQEVTSAGTSAGSAQAVQGVIGGVAMPVSATNLPLPTGAASASNQTNVQAAPGALASTAIGIQGVSGGVAVPITGSVSASFSGFTPTPSYSSPMSVGASSARQALPTGSTVIVYNTGTFPAYVTIGNTSVTATTANDVVFPNCWLAYAVGSAVDIAAIETAGTTTLNVSGGSGAAAGGCSAVLTGASTVTANQGTAGVSPWPISASALPLPTGAATAANQEVTAAGSSAGSAQAVQGVTGGVAMKVDGSAVTQPVSAASLPLPGGAATAANQEVTAAGSSASSAQAVQGVTGGVAMPVSAASLPLPSGASTAALQPTNAALGSTTSGQTGNLDIAAVTTAAPTYTNGQSNALSMTTAGALRTDASATTQPVSAPSLPLPAGAATLAGQTPFTTGGAYLNVSSVTNTSANSALPAGTNVVINNTGAFKIIYKLSTSGATSVTATTADGVVQAGATQEVAVGSNTNIAYSTTSVGLQSSLQVIGGTGIWIGSNTINASISQVGLAGPQNATMVAGPDNSGVLQSVQVTAPGTSATNFATAVQGVTGGVAMPVSAASLPLPTGAATAANQPTNATLGSTTSGQTGNLALGAVTTAAPTYTNAQSNSLSLTTGPAVFEHTKPPGGARRSRTFRPLSARPEPAIPRRSMPTSLAAVDRGERPRPLARPSRRPERRWAANTSHPHRR